MTCVDPSERAIECSLFTYPELELVDIATGSGPEFRFDVVPPDGAYVAQSANASGLSDFSQVLVVPEISCGGLVALLTLLILFRWRK